MTPNPPPEDLHTLVRVLLAFANCSRQDLAERAGVNPNTITNYCTGKSTPNRAMIERLARATEVSIDLVDTFLLPVIAARRLRAAGKSEGTVTDVLQRFETRMQGISRKLAETPVPLRAELEDPDKGWWPPETVRREALDLWNRLALGEEEDREPIIERWEEFHHPGLAELLCHESAEAASDDADRALKLASLAHRVAELVSGDPLRKLLLLGYTLLFISNCLRVAGNLPEARNKFSKGLRLWKDGAGASNFLAEWRVLDLEASLLRDERDFKRALSLLQQAFESSPAQYRARILLNRSAVLEQMGNGAEAIQVLRDAKPLIKRKREPRLFLTHRFNFASALCLMGRFEEPERMLPSITSLAKKLGLDLTNLRVKWLTGRIHPGRSRLDEAVSLLEEVRQQFTTRASAWDSSLVTLELATVYLRLGRTAEVQDIANELVWVFEAQGIHVEALAALTLFCQAALKETATVDLTERMARYLRKAQEDPKLRFKHEPKTLR
jgi:tetratricopeptide (TPR) repeat protein/DNA-binding XRE family transcriptional regulator